LWTSEQQHVNSTGETEFQVIDKKGYGIIGFTDVLSPITGFSDLSMFIADKQDYRVF
jgi:hypothetical protein